MRVSRWLVLIVLAVCVAAHAQQKSVAITVDDLPYAGSSKAMLTTSDVRDARRINQELLKAFRKHHVPVTGFVIEKDVVGLGPMGPEILRTWINEGLDLGNHTYSHRDINGQSVAEVESEILLGEATVAPLMKKAGKRVEFFRFPMNHTGETKEKHDEIAAFLAQHRYEVATCTIDSADYVFNLAYVRALEKKDKKFARKVRREYIAYTSSEIDYYASLNNQVLGYEPHEVMLLHDNRLNADVIEDLLRVFEEKGYKFVSLREAQSDPAYKMPDTFITSFGPMWGYRWARERNVRVNGRLEPEPPAWVQDHGK